MQGPVIICVSTNPGLDRRLLMRSMVVGAINRASSAQGFAGGKAAHVAMSAKALKANAAWIAFLGGAIGQECAAQMESLGVRVISVKTSAPTRVNLEIIEESGAITEILEPGGKPAPGEADDFLSHCREEIERSAGNAILAISGRLPAGVGAHLYATLIEAARAAGIPSFVDSSGEALQASVKAEPHFVKTNREEAEELLGKSMHTTEDAIAAAREIVARGAASAAITLGSEGLIWIETKNGPVWRAQPPRLKVISTVGCGDATLAGFAHAAAQKITGGNAIRLAAACGAANCLAYSPGMITLADMESLLPQIDVQQL